MSLVTNTNLLKLTYNDQANTKNYTSRLHYINAVHNGRGRKMVEIALGVEKVLFWAECQDRAIYRLHSKT